MAKRDMTERAFIYVMGAKGFPQKIGMAKSPRTRKNVLETGSFLDLTVSFAAALPRIEAHGAERLIQYRLADKCVRREWFDVTSDEAARAVADGITAYRAGERAPKSAGSDAEAVTALMPASLMRSVDEWRCTQDKIPSRADAIRRLVDLGLEAKKKK